MLPAAESRVETTYQPTYVYEGSTSKVESGAPTAYPNIPSIASIPGRCGALAGVIDARPFAPLSLSLLTFHTHWAPTAHCPRSNYFHNTLSLSLSLSLSLGPWGVVQGRRGCKAGCKVQGARCEVARCCSCKSNLHPAVHHRPPWTLASSRSTKTTPLLQHRPHVHTSARNDPTEVPAACLPALPCLPPQLCPRGSQLSRVQVARRCPSKAPNPPAF